MPACLCVLSGEKEKEKQRCEMLNHRDESHPGVAFRSLQETQWGWKSSTQELEDPIFNSDWSVP